MAIIRVWDEGDDSDGTTWATAYQSLENAAITGAAAGSEIWVASDHVQEPSSGNHIAVAFTYGSAAQMHKIISVKRSDNSYEKMTTGGGRISTLGTADDITLTGFFATHGLNIVAKDVFTAGSSNDVQIYEDCLIDATDSLITSPTESTIIFHGCTIYPRNSIAVGSDSDAIFRSCTFANALSTGIFNSNTTARQIIVEDCDLSSEADVIRSMTNSPKFEFRRCTMAASYVPCSVALYSGNTILFESCISGTSTKPVVGMQRWMTYYGDVYHEATIYRSGGAGDGETPYSWKMVSLAGAQEYIAPLRSRPITRWVDAGEQTLTININHAGGGTDTDLQNDEFWLEVSSPNESTPATARGRNQTTLPTTVLTAPTDLTNNTETWADGLNVKQHASVVITPTEPGPVTIYACLGRPSFTVYVDPKIEVS